MKVLINGTSLLRPLTGIGRYTLEICRRLDADATYYYGYYSKQLLQGGKVDRAGSGSIAGNALANKHIKNFLRSTMRLTSGINRVKYDIFWEPNNKIDILYRAKKTLLTLHDLSIVRHPEWHPADRVAHFNKMIKQSLNRADMVITDSDFSRNEILSHYGLPESKVRTILLGYDKNIFHCNKTDIETLRIKEKYTGGRDFILFAGSVEPRKNLVNLLKAYNALPEGYRADFRLLLAGFSGWENSEIMALIEKNKDSISYAGYVDYEELGSLYRSASLFAYPSYYEGFGLPPLEAMACGCPVVVSDRASLPQVCGDAVLYVSPDDADGIRDAVAKVLSDSVLAGALADRGLVQAAKFCWDRAASEHMQCMREML